MFAEIMFKDRNTDAWKDGELHTFAAEGGRGTIAVVLDDKGSVRSTESVRIISLKEHSEELICEMLLPALESGYCVCHTDTAG